MSMLFEYLYRDAGNFKAFGTMALDGDLSPAEQLSLRNCFPGDGLFVAEQVDVPPLYKDLYQWSDGPTNSDHCYHEFLRLRVIADASVPADAHRWGTANAFSERVRAVRSWIGELSPHFWLGS